MFPSQCITSYKFIVFSDKCNICCTCSAYIPVYHRPSICIPLSAYYAKLSFVSDCNAQSACNEYMLHVVRCSFHTNTNVRMGGLHFKIIRNSFNAFVTKPNACMIRKLYTCLIYFALFHPWIIQHDSVLLDFGPERKNVFGDATSSENVWSDYTARH